MKIKHSKCHSLPIIKRNCREIKFSVDGNEIPSIREKKALKVSVAATPYYLLIDIVDKT